MTKVISHYADELRGEACSASHGEMKAMSINAITQATGADLLDLYSQSVGQGSTETSGAASAAALKTAIAEAQLSEESVLGSGGGQTGTQINVYG